MRNRIAAVAIAVVAGLGLTAAANVPAATGASFSKGGVSIKVSVTCPSTGTTVTKISSTGGNPGYAARVRNTNGVWSQGTEVNSGTAVRYLGAATHATAHGTRIFWASGAQNYTFC